MQAAIHLQPDFCWFHQQPDPTGIVDLVTAVPTVVFVPTTTQTPVAPVQTADVVAVAREPITGYARPAFSIPWVRVEISMAPPVAPVIESSTTPVFRGPRGLSPITSPAVVLELLRMDPGWVALAFRGTRGLSPIVQPALPVLGPASIVDGCTTPPFRGPRGLSPITAPPVVLEPLRMDPGWVALAFRGPRGLSPIVQPTLPVPGPASIVDGCTTPPFRGPRGLSPTAQSTIPVLTPELVPATFAIGMASSTPFVVITSPTPTPRGDVAASSVTTATATATPFVLVEPPAPMRPGELVLSAIALGLATDTPLVPIHVAAPSVPPSTPDTRIALVILEPHARPLVQSADIVDRAELRADVPTLITAQPIWQPIVLEQTVDRRGDLAGDLAWVHVATPAVVLPIVLHVDLPERAWLPPTAVPFVRVPPRPPNPPGPGTATGGGGGGGWVPDCPDDYIYNPEGDYCEPAADAYGQMPPRARPILTEIPPMDGTSATGGSVVDAVAELLGPGVAGYSATRAAAKLGAKVAGKTGELVANVASVATTVAATKRFETLGKVRASLIAGSTLAAVDSIAKAYLGAPEPAPAPSSRWNGRQVVRMPDDRSFMLQALAAKAHVEIHRQINPRTNRLVIGYSFTSSDPPTLWLYKEQIPIDAAGNVDLTGTLMAKLR